MTRAKDISKILTDADFSGTLDVTGAVTAGGLDIQGDGTISGGSRLTISDIADENNDGIRLDDNTTSRYNNLTQDTSGNFKIQHYTGSAWQNNLTVTTTGNVGIGTSSPSGAAGTTLAINGGSGQSRLALKNTSTGDASGDGFQLSVGTDGSVGIEQRENNYMALYTNATERMRIHSGGQLSLATTDATHGFNVGQSGTDFRGRFQGNNQYRLGLQNGTSNLVWLGSGGADNFRVSNSAGSTRFELDSAGRGTFSSTSDNTVSSGTGIVNVNLEQTRQNGKGPFIGFRVPNHATSTTNEDMGAIGFVATDSNTGSRKADFVVYTRNTTFGEKMRVQHDGTVFVGKTSGALTTVGQGLLSDGSMQITANEPNAVLYINRQVLDGSLIRFYHAGSQEGSIDVSGSTVSYNGGHLSRWSRLLDNSKDETIVKGTVMTNLDEMVEWGDEDNEQLNKMAVSSVEGDANVAGVFVNWDNSDDWNDMNVAMTGDMVIRIAQGTTVSRGDLLMSAGDGTAKPQGDDIVRSKTIAKVTSTNVSHTYDDGTYLVPCVLMAC